MISGIVMKEHPYVLKDDRNAPAEQQTVFTIIPKTVLSANETAANYAGVSKVNRKTQVTEVDVPKMNAADDSEWSRAIKRITNFFMPVGAPREGFEYFASRLPEGSTKDGNLEKIEGGIIVKLATSEQDLLHIRWALCPDHQEEVMDAYYNYSRLTEGRKNV